MKFTNPKVSFHLPSAMSRHIPWTTPWHAHFSSTHQNHRLPRDEKIRLNAKWYVQDKSYCLWSTSKDSLSLQLTFIFMCHYLPDADLKRNHVSAFERILIFTEVFLTNVNMVSSIIPEGSEWNPEDQKKFQRALSTEKAETKEILCKYLNPIVLCQRVESHFHLRLADLQCHLWRENNAVSLGLMKATAFFSHLLSTSARG